MLVKKLILEYFAFTKKERRGILLLLTLLILLISLSYYYKYSNEKNALVSSQLKQQLDSLHINLDSNNIDSRTRIFKKEKEFDNNHFRDYSSHFKSFDKKYSGTLFYFDPNKLDENGWQKLGISDKTAQTIQNYLSKGGRFRTPEDIAKIYGLSDEMVERLMPFVAIKTEAKSFDNTIASSTAPITAANNYSGNSYEDFLATYKIDINTADTTAWKKLPGIGSKLSYRIINYKNKLGGFYNTRQVAETFGLPDSTFQKIKNNLVCNPTEIIKVNINTVTAETFHHPYIDKSLANNILQYRQQHGNYTTIGDLRKLALMTESVLEKITPYITVE